MYILNYVITEEYLLLVLTHKGKYLSQINDTSVVIYVTLHCQYRYFDSTFAFLGAE